MAIDTDFQPTTIQAFFYSNVTEIINIFLRYQNTYSQHKPVETLYQYPQHKSHESAAKKLLRI